MAVKKLRPHRRFLVDGEMEALVRQVEAIEKLARENRRILDVQFKRIAEMQAELDDLKRRRRYG